MESDNKKYEIKVICHSTDYTSESKDHLPGVWYLVLWKSNPKENNTWELALAILNLCKLISILHHDHRKRPIVTSPLIDFALPMAGPIVKLKAKALSIKQKRGQTTKANSTSKYAKNS